LNCPTNKIVICGNSWSFDTPTYGDTADGTNVVLTITSTVTNGSCGQAFSATRTWTVTDRCGNSVSCSQTVMNSTLLVGGMVYYPATYPSLAPSGKAVAGVTLNVSESTNMSLLSGSDGAYSFSANA